MNNTQNLSISQLRQNATTAVNSVVDKQEPAVIFQRSKPTAVLVEYNYFKALEEAVIDLSDAREAERAKKEEKIPLQVYIKKRWG